MNHAKKILFLIAFSVLFVLQAAKADTLAELIEKYPSTWQKHIHFEIKALRNDAGKIKYFAIDPHTRVMEGAYGKVVFARLLRPNEEIPSFIPETEYFNLAIKMQKPKRTSIFGRFISWLFNDDTSEADIRKESQVTAQALGAKTKVFFDGTGKPHFTMPRIRGQKYDFKTCPPLCG